jgi:hypothetical protein
MEKTISVLNEDTLEVSTQVVQTENINKMQLEAQLAMINTQIANFTQQKQQVEEKLAMFETPIVKAEIEAIAVAREEAEAIKADQEIEIIKPIISEETTI